MSGPSLPLSSLDDDVAGSDPQVEVNDGLALVALDRLIQLGPNPFGGLPVHVDVTGPGHRLDDDSGVLRHLHGQVPDADEDLGDGVCPFFELEAGHVQGEVSSSHLVSGPQRVGVGDFDLPLRGYSREQNEDMFRVSFSGPVARNFFNEMRLQLRHQSNDSRSLSDAPAVLVLDAFN